MRDHGREAVIVNIGYDLIRLITWLETVFTGLVNPITPRNCTKKSLLKFHHVSHN